MKWHFKNIFSVTSFLMIIVFSIPVQSIAQSDLESRVDKLETYVSSFEPTLSQFAKDLEGTMQSYTKDLESGLTDYSEKLQTNLSEQINNENGRVIILDIASKTFQKIETNVGPFLIYVDKINAVDKGYRLYLYIGNTYSANFKDINIKLIHGKKFPQGGVMSREAWRRTLIEREYPLDTILEKGKWNLVELDVSPAETKDLEYIEFSLFIYSVELDLKK